jgi:hypothetical protein
VKAKKEIVKPTKDAPRRKRKVYVVSFTLTVEQDVGEQPIDEAFAVENSVRVDLECLKAGLATGEGHVVYLDIDDVGAEACEP